MLDASAKLLSTGLMTEPTESFALPAREMRTEVSGRDAGLALLVQRMARGEKAALAELYDATSSLLNGLLLRMPVRAEDAEEILMDVYMRAWKKAGTFSAARGTVQAWLVLMARNMAIEQIRQHPTHGDVPGFAMDDAGPEDASDRRQLVRVLRELPQEQREVLELAFFSGCTLPEIAARLGQTPGTIRSRLGLALGRLHGLPKQEVAA